MPFSRQIRSNSTSTGGWLNRPVNTFPLSVRICPGTPWVRSAERTRRRPAGGLPQHQHRAHAEPGMVIDPGQRLRPTCRRRAANPPTTSICHISIGTPRSHRFHFRSRRPADLGSISPSRASADRPPTQTAPGPPRPGQLEHQPPRPPPRMRPPHLGQRHLHRRRHLMRTRPRPVRPVSQALQPFALIPGQPHMQRLPRHPEPRRRDLHRVALGDHRQHRQIPLLGHAQFPHDRECHQSAEVAVTQQPKHWEASSEGETSPIRRSHTKTCVRRQGLEPRTRGLRVNPVTPHHRWSRARHGV